MLASLEQKQVVGKYFSGSQLCFHWHRLEFFSPVNNTVLHMDLETNRSELIPIAARSKTMIVALCRDNQILLVSDSENRVYVYSLPRKQLLGSKKFKAEITAIEFAHSNRFFVVAAGKDLHYIERPDPEAGVLLEPLSLIRKVGTKALRGITMVKFVKNDRYVIYAGDDSTVRVVPTFKSRFQTRDWQLHGHKGLVTDVRETLTEDGFLYTFDTNGLLLLWKLVDATDSDGMAPERDSRKRVKQGATSQDMEVEAPTPGQETDPEAAAQPSPADLLNSFELKMESSKFILQAKHMIFQENVTLKRYDFHDNLLVVGFSNASFSLYSLHPSDPEPFRATLTFKLTETNPQCVLFHPKNSVLAIANTQSGIAVWDYRTKGFLLSQTRGLNEVSAFAFNDKGSVLAVGDSAGSVRLFDTKTYFGIVNFGDAMAQITQIRFIKDNTMLVSSLDGVVRAYDLTKNKLFRELRTSVNNQILAMVVEKGGDLVVGSGADPYDIYIWSLRTGNLLEVLSNHTSSVHLLQYANQKGMLVSGSWDRSVRVFNLLSKDKAEERVDMGDRVVDIKIAKSEKFFGVATARNELHFFTFEEMQLFSLIDLKAEFPGTSLNSFELSFDGKTAFIVGGVNGMFSVDIDHKTKTGKLVLTGNRDYRFHGEKLSSRTVRDGLETKTNYLTYQVEKNGLVLPGSVGAHAKQAERPTFQATSITSSPDGQTLVIASSEGLTVFGAKAERHYWKLSADVTKESLFKLIEEKKLVEFSIICLHLRLFSLFELVAWKLDPESVYSVLRSLSPDLLVALTDFLRATLDQGVKMEVTLLWIRTLLKYKLAQLETPEMRSFVTFLCGLVTRKLDDFVSSCEYSDLGVDFLISQIDQN